MTPSSDPVLDYDLQPYYYISRLGRGAIPDSLLVAAACHFTKFWLFIASAIMLVSNLIRFVVEWPNSLD